MTTETDLLVDRRRLKRRLVGWQVTAVLAVLACAFIAAGRFSGGGGFGGPYVARLSVTGLITEDRKLTQRVNDLATDDRVSALIVYVDSPGGSVAGGETIHDAVARVAAKKPVVTVMGGTAASAGYMISVPAARIFARDATLTGSIGVILQTGEVSGLLSDLGITTEAITSGPLKDQPSFTRGLTRQGRDVLQGLVMDMYDQFVGMVAAGRHMDADAVRTLADGRAYTGRQALKLGLVDAIGGEPEARAWLAAERKVPESLPVRDVERKRGLLRQALADDISPLFDRALGALLGPRPPIGGAWAIWQPGGSPQ